MAKQNLYQRVDEAIERGETWRAKEILRGNVGSGSYDSQLYERYGKLLLDLGELVEAGKYLFLSGRRHPEYDEAIEVYLSCHPESRPELLFRSFPLRARFRELHRYPLEVRRALEERACPNTSPTWTGSGPRDGGGSGIGCKTRMTTPPSICSGMRSAQVDGSATRRSGIGSHPHRRRWASGCWSKASWARSSYFWPLPR